MNERLRLLVVMQGSIDWVGGVEYIRNLVLAVSTLPEAKAGGIDMSLLASKWATTGLPAIASQVNRTYYVEEELGIHSILDKIKGKLARHNTYRPDRRYDAFFDRRKFDFAYPYLGSGNGRTRSAAWIPDFQHKVLPQYFSPEEIQSRDRSFRNIADHAKVVVLSSQCAERDFHRFLAPTRGQSRVLPFRTVPEDSWYEGDGDAVRLQYNLPERFFLICNQFWKHKQHLMVLEALGDLNRKGLRPKLICTGHPYDYRDPAYASRVLQTIHMLGLADQVYVLGLIPRRDQMQLMRHSIAVIQPSLFEGWSTVVEDARCLGKHLVLSDIPVHREQAPPGACYFDPSSTDQLGALLEDIWRAEEPGRNMEQEAVARATQREHVMTFARTFLNIAEGV